MGNSTQTSDKLSRPTIGEVPLERHFELQAVFNIERTRINKHLEASANSALGGANATVESASEARNAAIREVRDIFTQEEKQTNNKLFGMNQELKESAPKYRSWVLWNVLAVFFGVLEVTIGVLMGFDEEGFNPAPAGVGLFLWAGGFLLGHGWGNLNKDNRIEKMHDHFDVPLPRGRSRTIEWIKVAVGALIVVAMSLLRSLGEMGLMMGVIFSFSVVLAVGIGFFENLALLYFNLYQWCRERMLECQRSFATIEHKKRCEVGADYYQVYQEHVQSLAMKAGSVRQVAAAPTPAPATV